MTPLLTSSSSSSRRSRSTLCFTLLSLSICWQNQSGGEEVLLLRRADYQSEGVYIFILSLPPPLLLCRRRWSVVLPPIWARVDTAKKKNLEFSLPAYTCTYRYICSLLARLDVYLSIYLCIICCSRPIATTAFTCGGRIARTTNG